MIIVVVLICEFKNSDISDMNNYQPVLHATIISKYEHYEDYIYIL